MNAILSEMTIPKDSPFKYGDDPISHAAKNVVSFYLAYMSNQLKAGQKVCRFADCAEELVQEEYKRPLYRGIRGPLEKIYEETLKIAGDYLDDQYASGAYAEVHNKVLEMNEEWQAFKIHLMTGFRKQTNKTP